MLTRTSLCCVPALLLASVIVPRAAASEVEAVTLAEAVELALKRHPDVEKARVAADILKARIREVRAQALPDIAVNSSFTRWRDPSLLNASGLDKFPAELRDALVPSAVNLFDYHIAFKQPVYTAGKVGTAMRLASVEAEGALSDIDRARQNLALEVTRAFFGLLWAERYAALAAETQRQKELHAEMARTRFRNGVATEVDVLRSEVNVANGAPELVRARNAVRQARAQLNYYMARPLDFATRASGDFEEKPLAEDTVEKLAFEASRRRPELARLRIAERSARAQMELAGAESRMKVDFAATYGVMSRLPSNLGNPQFTRWTAGFNFSFPLFDGFRRSSLISQAIGVERGARLERQRVEEQVRLALQQGLDEMSAAAETIRAARANEEQAEKVLAMMQNNYKFGAATTLDIVDAQTALSVARTNLLRGLHEFAVARAGLRWTAGMTPWE